MKEYQGISASPGIVIGKVFLHQDENPVIPDYAIVSSDVEKEIERFKDAVKRATSELSMIKKGSEDTMGADESRFLDSHILLLEDPDFEEKIIENLNTELKNVEWVLHQVSQTMIRKMNSLTDEYMRERSLDITDVSRRVLNHLLYKESLSLADIDKEIILVTHNLMPSAAVSMNKRFVKGIAMDAGGKTSHTAILARSFEIPAVLGLGAISRFVHHNDYIIIDGNSGKVILNPDKATLVRYKVLQTDWEKREVELLFMNELSPETKDGKLINLKANIEIPEEIDSVKSHGADGIGLYRSEFLYMEHFATEEEQFEAYRKVVGEMEGKTVTIRTLDIGGDKTSSALEGVYEQNPILGWRAVRFCLARKDIFRTQLRALLRASVYGNMRIMFPMISGLEELEMVLEELEKAKVELTEEGIPFVKKIPVGIMIEVPSAALSSDVLARKVDFFSIGTNDLIQYTIAVDRGNEKIAYLYEPFHPGVLRLIKMVISNAHASGIPVGMCGEMAGDPLASVILLGMGLDEFSMSSFGIPQIKRIIRSVSMMDAEELVGQVMEMKSFRDIDKFVREWMVERFDFLEF